MPRRRRFLAVAVLYGGMLAGVMADEFLIIDDRGSADQRSSLGPAWRLVTDGVMGGVSSGQLTLDRIAGRDCLRLQGTVSLENNGGFLQAALDLAGTEAQDATSYRGVLLEVHGNAESYNVHLRSADLFLPWQAYRATFQTRGDWQTLRLPFHEFRAYRTRSALDTGRLRRLGLVAIGRAFTADLCVARVALYR